MLRPPVKSVAAMVNVRTLRNAGGSIAIKLPKTLTERFNMTAGDKVLLVETDRGILITPYDPDFQDAVDAFETVRTEYCTTLRKLAE